MTDEQMRKMELALKHLAVVALELGKIQALLGDDTECLVGSLDGQRLETAALEITRVGQILSGRQTREEPEAPLPWESRLRGTPRRKLVGYEDTRSIPSQETLREAHKLRKEGSITEAEFQERTRVKRGKRAIYDDAPSLPYRTLYVLPQEPAGWRLYNAPGVCAFCGSLTCNGRCVK